jgi:type III secretory pathway component EscR
MNQYGSNWVIGASLANHEINKCMQYNRSSYSPYNFYYEKMSKQNHDNVFSEVAQTHFATEYGILAGQEEGRDN